MNKHLPANFWALDDAMTVVLFAGVGGGCDGIEAAGFPVHLAVNHDRLAIAVHSARHPHTRHLRCDVFEVEPRSATNGRRVGRLHASPDCTHFSNAKGGKPVSKRRRSLAWVVPRWMGQVRPDVVTLENVQEIQSWGPLIAKRDPATGRVLKLDDTVAAKGERVPVENQQLVPDPKHKGRIWRAWLKHVEGLGYRFETRVLVCSDYGVPTIRKRLFGIGVADGGPIYWPARTHAPRDKAKALKLKPWVGAHTIIDWSLPVKSIFDRKKPLAPATMRRIARGIIRYVIDAKRPFIVPITHSGGDRVHSIDEPLRTLTTANRGELAVIVPHMSTMRNAQKPYNGADEPLHTLTAGGAGITLVAASMIQAGNGEHPGQVARCLDVENPLGTQTAGGQRQAVVAAFLAQHNTDIRRDGGVNPGRAPADPLATVTATPQVGVVAVALGRLRGSDVSGQSIEEPLPAQTSGGHHEMLILPFLQTYYGSGLNAHDVRDPLHTVTTGDRHGLVTVEVDGVTMVVTDIGMRMLDPLEGARAHGFDPASFDCEIEVTNAKGKVTRRKPNKTEIGELVGNSVPPYMIQILHAANTRNELMVAAE